MNSKTLIGIYAKITLMSLRHEMYALKSITIFISVYHKERNKQNTLIPQTN
jgi:hypothetical protein